MSEVVSSTTTSTRHSLHTNYIYEQWYLYDSTSSVYKSVLTTQLEARLCNPTLEARLYNPLHFFTA